MNSTAKKASLLFATTLALSSLSTHALLAADAVYSEEINQPDDTTSYQENGDWSVTITTGVIAAPRFLGDDDFEASAFPNISITYKDWLFASIGGVGANVVNSNGFKAGPIVKYDFGRSETDSNPLSLSGDPNNDLVGLGDIDGSIEFGGFVEYNHNNFEARFEVRQGLDGGHEGMIGEVSLSYNDQFTIGEIPIIWSAGPTLKFGDDNYNSAFFDVNAAQSAASGLATYDANAGLISYGLEGNVVIPTSERTAIIAFGSLEKLGSEIADSSLVTTRGSDFQAKAGVMFSYKLW